MKKIDHVILSGTKCSRRISTYLFFSVLVAFLAACSGEGGNSTNPRDDEFAALSSAEEQGNSSFVKSGSDEPSLSSSFEKKTKSSSSEKLSETSSSSVDKVNCSALLEEERKNKKWSWNVPKECRFNPDVEYDSMTDVRDGQVYRTVKIGDQTWMAENLNFDPGQGGSGEDEYDWSWCYYYDYVHKNCKVIGRFYTWAAAIDSVALYDGGRGVDCGFVKICTLPDTVYGICPPGWHLPDTTEWNTLFTAVGGRSAAGLVLKSQSGWHGNGNGLDTFGYSALPAGLKDFHGLFGGSGYNVRFWSSTEYLSNYAYLMYLDDTNDGADLLDDRKDYGFSVRCLKN